MLRRKSVFGLAAGALITMASSAGATVVYDYVNISSYANNNIYTDLNQNFPNTGAGTPGSHTGVANATFLFTPWTYTPPAAAGSGVPYNSYSAPLGNNGVSFQLNSNSEGQDFAQIGASGPTGYTGPSPITVTIGQNNVTTVYFLMGSYTGQSFNVTFNEVGGGTETFNSIALPDFNGGTINTCGVNYCDQTVYIVNDVGGGGTGNSATGDTNNYSMTEVAFDFTSPVDISSAEITSNGYETLLFGITTANVASVPEPYTWAMILVGFGGLGAALRRASRGKWSAAA